MWLMLRCEWLGYRSAQAERSVRRFWPSGLSCDVVVALRVFVAVVAVMSVLVDVCDV